MDENKEKFKHKKSLGQNFLKTESILDLIVSSGEIKPGDFLLEIGPGEGALTVKILNALENIENNSKNKMLTIEKDYRLIPILKKRFEKDIEEGKLEVLEKDILKFDPDTIKTSYKLIANIPYYITGAIIEKFLSAKNKPEIIIVMVQREVAERVTSKENKESILSLATKFYGESEIVKIVKPGNFNPPPKVDSAILKIKVSKDRIDQLRKESVDFEKIYLEIIKSGLAHKRKVLISNLKAYDKNFDWKKVFEDLNINEKVRGEDLKFEIWVNITREYLKSMGAL